MKICITSEGKDLSASVDPRFGRCKYFIFVESDNMQFEAISNPNIDASGGAGIQSAQFIISKGIEAILTGNIGPNAYQVLASAGIKIFTGVSGTTQQAINSYKNGQYKITNTSNVGSKFGIPGKNQ